jgi:MFS family permease
LLSFVEQEEFMTDYTRIARKITTTLFINQSLVSAGFIATATVSAILGAQLSGNPALAGVPSAVQQLGVASAALLVSASMDRIGRRRGLALGLMIGALGAGLAAKAVVDGSFALFLGGLLLMGVALAAMQLGRFAAAEVHPTKSRGRAISYVVIGGAVGSVLGPLLVGPSSRWVQQTGLNELAGPYLVALGIYALAALVITIWLRPDPRDVGVKVAELDAESDVQQRPTRTVSQIFRTRAAFVAISAMVIGQVVMVMIMGITSLYMKNHQHTLTNISLVISAHTFGMYAFSIVSGRLTDRWGRGPVIMTGAGLLVAAGLLAPLSTEVLPLAVALLLLGIGWNFCYVGGSTLLSDQLSPAERAKTQGTNDLMLGLATASASLSSGLLYATVGYNVMGAVGAALALVPLGLTAWWMLKSRAVSESQVVQSS